MLQGSPPLLLTTTAFTSCCIAELIIEEEEEAIFLVYPRTSGWQLILAMSPPAAKFHALLGTITASSHHSALQD
jgi:hypothetical protein